MLDIGLYKLNIFICNIFEFYLSYGFFIIYKLNFELELIIYLYRFIFRNANPRFCTDTLINLIKIYNNLEFGNNTYRLEKIHLKYLMQRVYRLLPDYLKCTMNQSMYVHGHVWKHMDFQYFPIQKKKFVEDIYQVTLEKINEIGTDKFTQKDFTILVSTYELVLENYNVCAYKH